MVCYHRTALFGYTIKLCYCEHRELNGRHLVDMDAFGGYQQGNFRIWINKDECDCVTAFLATLTHECIHAVYDIVRNISAESYPTDLIGEELMAHLTDKMVADFVKQITGVDNG
jgi:hypothetical protein